MFGVMNALECTPVISSSLPRADRPVVAPATTGTPRLSSLRWEAAGSREGRAWGRYGVAALVAVLAHAALAWGGGQAARVPVRAPVSEPVTITMTLAPVEPEEEVDVAGGESASEAARSALDSFAPPQLVDVPSFGLEATFWQPAQLARPHVESVTLPSLTLGRSEGAGLGARVARVFSLAAVDQVPELRFSVEPRYPRDLQRSGVQGEVIVSFVVTHTGEVRDVAVVSSTHAEFERAAIQAVSQWRFRPGSVRGAPVATRMEQPIGFSLKG